MDTVNLVMAYEAAYRLDIPDADAARMSTPRDVIDFLLPLLGEREQGPAICLSARAFYSLRRAVGGERRAGSDAPLLEMLGPEPVRRWSQLRDELDCEYWPRLKRDGLLQRFFGGVDTLGDAASELALFNPRRFHPEPWTRAELELSLMRITEYEAGLPAGRFGIDSRYVQDMRLD